MFVDLALKPWNEIVAKAKMFVLADSDRVG
jgi:hypothetical protein